jgi:hypothetical protein
MKKLLILLFIVSAPFFVNAQSCDKSAASSCAQTSCGPEGTKKAEAAVISKMRSDLQTVIARMSKSTLAFDKTVSDLEITKGTSDDESLLFISQAANSIRHEFVSKIESTKLIASLRQYQPSDFSNKQQMVSALKKEIQILSNQAEKL